GEAIAVTDDRLERAAELSELLPQALDDGIDHVAAAEALLPDVLEELVPRDHAPGVGVEVLHHPELQLGEGDGAGGGPQCARFDVEGAGGGRELRVDETGEPPEDTAGPEVERDGANADTTHARAQGL